MAAGDLMWVDWARTALPPPQEWPAGLPALVRLVLAAPTAMALMLGEDAVVVYNDRYAATLGIADPSLFGQPARVIFGEVWDTPGNRDALERVMRTGTPYSDSTAVLALSADGRGGMPEPGQAARALTAVRADDGTLLGVLVVLTGTAGENRALAGVVELTTRLSAAASVDAVAREALEFAVGHAGADHARILLADGPALRMARRAKVDGSDDTVDRLPPVWVRTARDERLPSVEVMSSGAPLWLGHSEVASYGGLAHEPLAADSLQRVATVPLRAGTVRGALSFAWETAGEFSDTDRATFTAVGNLVAQSLVRAAHFDAQHELADSLQLAMLPAWLPQPAGIGVAASYVPSGDGAAAGGDFYDAFELPDARLVLIIGDVVGHGAHAATVMGQVRAATRVLALRDPDPSRILDGLDGFVASLGDESFVTMAVAVLDGGRCLRLASAGHPAPVLCTRTGSGRYDGAAVEVPAGPPVGVPGARVSVDVGLGTGDVLVLFTDGLVEIPGEDPDIALEQLVVAATRAAVTIDPRRICGALLNERVASGDDVALLVLAVHERAHLLEAVELPAEATSPGRARTWTRQALARWGLPSDLMDSAVLGVSELVSNAILHARSGARVELDLDDSRLLVLVTDRGSHAVPARQDVDGTANRGRGLAVIDMLCDAWAVEQTARGTTVWFELAREPAGDAAVPS
jgi:anti-sigma regulatory factor (Ser/Thr protein kinase)